MKKTYPLINKANLINWLWNGCYFVQLLKCPTPGTQTKRNLFLWIAYPAFMKRHSLDTTSRTRVNFPTFLKIRSQTDAELMAINSNIICCQSVEEIKVRKYAVFIEILENYLKVGTKVRFIPIMVVRMRNRWGNISVNHISMWDEEKWNRRCTRQLNQRGVRRSYSWTCGRTCRDLYSVQEPSFYLGIYRHIITTCVVTIYITPIWSIWRVDKTYNPGRFSAKLNYRRTQGKG